MLINRFNCSCIRDINDTCVIDTKQMKKYIGEEKFDDDHDFFYI